MKKLVDKEEYEEAVAIADTIEWKRVRSVRTLCLVSEIYEIVGRAQAARIFYIVLTDVLQAADRFCTA